MRNALILLAPLLFGAIAWGQSNNSTLSFEVASIKPSPPPDGRGLTMGCHRDPGRSVCTNIHVDWLISMAYGVSSDQISGLSGDTGSYEVAVKLPPGATREQIALMWQDLLAERFKLKVHRESKEVQGYALVVAKGGSKMQVAAEAQRATDAPPPSLAPAGPVTGPRLGSDGFPELRPGMSMAMMGNKARWREAAATTERIASVLSAQMRQPVVDATGLEGKYAFTLSWVAGSLSAGRGAAAAGQPEGGALIADASDPDGQLLTDAIQSQLGLRLEPKKVPVQMLVVDHVEKPTEN